MLELNSDGRLVFYMCAGCGHVGISSTNLALLCHHCQTDDADWQEVHLENLIEDLQFINQQLESVRFRTQAEGDSECS